MTKGFRFGLGVVAGLLFSVAALAGESVPIEDKDAFEKQYLDCIVSGARDNCLVSIFSNHLDPQFTNQDVIVDRFSRYYQEKMATPSVYKVHLIEKTIKAEVFDNRSYLIERDNGSLVGFYVSFRSIKDKWFVFTFKVSNTEEYVFKLLGMPIVDAVSKD
ncbi:MAG: hypothetical protein LBU53_06440 [Zoogloeaceae bacterium]|jgi:ferric iron reductase protein FhuF|nr:hypothetical protein [Zoogloeaceae bacterium]